MMDPCGSDMEVPILSAENDKLSGHIKPLGGTTEDPSGAGRWRHNPSGVIRIKWQHFMSNQIQTSSLYNNCKVFMLNNILIVSAFCCSI